MHHPTHILPLFLAAAPAAAASLFAAAAASTASLSDARKRAIADSAPTGSANALRRYVHDGATIESRWMIARVAGIATSALLLHRELAQQQLPFELPWAVLGAILAFAIPSELLKAVAVRSSEHVAPWLIRLLRPFEWLTWPIGAPIGLTRRFAEHLLPAPRPATSAIVGDEVGIIVSEGEKTGSIPHEEAEMLKNVLDFSTIVARDIMVPRTRVAALELGVAPEELVRRVVADEHSRFPVYAERIDNVVGVLHVKDLLAVVAREHGLRELDLESLIHRPALFVTENQPATGMLKEMRAMHQHLAIVIDEFGGMSGIVTLEDLLERIVGDIRDEHDEDEASFTKLDGGRFMVHATLSLSDLARNLEVELPDTEGVTTLGGWVVAYFGRVPPIGARMTEFGYDLIVREADERRVIRVELAPMRQTDSMSPKSQKPPARGDGDTSPPRRA